MIVKVAQSKNQSLRHGLAIAFLYYYDRSKYEGICPEYTSDDCAVIMERYYPVLDYYSTNSPKEKQHAIAVIGAVIEYALAHSKVPEATIFREVYYEVAGCCPLERRAFHQLGPWNASD